MGLRNTSTNWGLPAKALHWISAAMIVFLIAFGVWMTGFTERSAAVRLPLYGIHAWVGVTVLVLLAARLAWRASNVTPDPPADGPAWQRKTASVVHGLLYLLVGAQCLLGWALVGTFPADARAQMSGIDALPMLINSTDRALHEGLETLHYATAMTILAVVVLHIGAALRHHFFLRNDVLTRMLTTGDRPMTFRKPTIALAAALFAALPLTAPPSANAAEINEAKMKASNTLAGRTFQYEVAGYKIKVDFLAEDKLRWTYLDAPDGQKGKTAEEDLDRRDIHYGIILLSWTEADGSHVVDVLDLQTMTLHATAIMPDGKRFFTKAAMTEAK